MSMLINGVLSAAFFMLIFGLSRPVEIWRPRNYVFDFLPQGLLIGVMSVVVPGKMAGQARRKRRVERYKGTSLLPRQLGLRALVVRVVSMVGAALCASAVLYLAGQTHLPATGAMLAKAVFGASLALMVTPPGLRAALKS